MNTIRNPQTLSFSQHSRTHFRSASWSHTSGAATSIPLISPIRVIQEFVPGFSPSARRNDDNDSPPSWSGPRHRPENSGHGHLSRSASGIDLEAGENAPNSQDRSTGSQGRQTGDRVEFYGAIAWAENTLPFILLLCSRIMWDHRLGEFRKIMPPGRANCTEHRDCNDCKIGVSNHCELEAQNYYKLPLP